MGDLAGLLAWVAAGSALGGVARFFVSGLVARGFGETFPWGTMIVNVSGCFAIGALAAVTRREGLLASPEAWALAVTGFLGSYTTVSSFSLQTLALAREGEWLRAIGNIVLSLALCLGAAALGLAAGLALTGETSSGGLPSLIDQHEVLVLTVFFGVYLGMAVGRWPKLALDRTGIALCGAIVLLFFDEKTGASAAGIDTATLAVLFGLMVLSAQFAACGIYEWCAQRLAAAVASPAVVLALVVAVTGALSSLLANDIVVFAMTPVLCQGLTRAGRDPRPYLLAHAGAANVGSAATLVGNPQNILIGEHGSLGFWHYLAFAAPLAVVGLAVVYLVVLAVWRRQLGEAATPAANASAPQEIRLDRALLVKGLLATLLLLALYTTALPRWQSTLLVAGILLVSRRLSTREMLAAVDWHLLVLFGGLFVVTGALSGTAFNAQAVDLLQAIGFSFEDPLLLGATALIGSNTVGNVPLVILLLSALPGLSTEALYALAVLSTFAGNLLLIGSLANLIMVERARHEGIAVSFGDHLRTGVPMTLATLALAYGWFQVT
ncbi:fluoride efflux transporter CrcB [Paracoccus binzhouensis]|uniref:fluoride efflux transporter CrcB n=1 Tax=Paracoccus binzhouensis TaxID=2796149 RepID=UPI0018EF2819|nr:fluoride efflux transporter CrcB [Paracoccus binzhouensis]